MPYSKVKVIELHPSVMFSEKGTVARWGKNVGRQAYRSVRGEAPERTGRLKEAVFWSRRFSQASMTGRIEVGVDLSIAPHAKHVLDGTDEISGNPWLAIPPDKKFPSFGPPRVSKTTGRLIVRSVRGQKANDFITRGWNRVARRHAAVAEFRER